MNLPEHATRNRAQWNTWAADFVDAGRRNWATAEPSWGIWNLPGSRVDFFQGIERFAGTDAIELGCGTGYVSSWLTRAGARVTGIDISDEQLRTAGELRAQHDLTDISFLQASAEAVPLPDASFDLAVSEYGASIWCDPYAWIPEAARLLRVGGELIFLVNGLLAMLCMDEAGIQPALQRPLFGLHRVEWDDDDSVEFHLPHGEWIRLLRANGFEVERLLELQAPADAKTTSTWADSAWATKWPTEEVWHARKVR
ncbi:MAG: type 11 methyltransferase [Thermoleophilia bacterium]|nr:type 11 methyltransferase [Thermoleophilia bacterium]